MRSEDTKKFESCCELLEIPYDSSLADIKGAYREQLKVWHPDRFEHMSLLRTKAEQRSIRLIEAYTFLNRNHSFYAAELVRLEEARRTADNKRAAGEAQGAQPSEQTDTGNTSRFKRQAQPRKPRGPEADTVGERSATGQDGTTEKGTGRFRSTTRSSAGNESYPDLDQITKWNWLCVFRNFLNGKRVAQPLQTAQGISALMIAEGLANEIGRNLRFGGKWLTLASDRPLYTTELFRSLAAVGRLYGLESYTDKPCLNCRVSHDSVKYDFVWKDRGDLTLAVESELAPHLQEILRDFEKLVHAPSTFRALVHRYAQDKVVRAVESELANCKRHTNGDVYIIIRLDDFNHRLDAHTLTISGSGSVSPERLRFSPIAAPLTWVIHDENVPGHVSPRTSSNPESLGSILKRFVRLGRELVSVGWWVAKLTALVVLFVVIIQLGNSALSWIKSLDGPSGEPIVGLRKDLPNHSKDAEIITTNKEVRELAVGDTGVQNETATGRDDETQPQRAGSPTPVALSAKELETAFARNKREATLRFKAEVVRLTGKITKLGTKELSIGSVRCKFEQDAILPGSGVELGTSITIEGTIKGKSFWTRKITLVGCRVVSGAE